MSREPLLDHETSSPQPSLPSHLTKYLYSGHFLARWGARFCDPLWFNSPKTPVAVLNMLSSGYDDLLLILAMQCFGVFYTSVLVYSLYHSYFGYIKTFPSFQIVPIDIITYSSFSSMPDVLSLEHQSF